LLAAAAATAKPQPQVVCWSGIRIIIIWGLLRVLRQQQKEVELENGCESEAKCRSPLALKKKPPNSINTCNCYFFTLITPAAG